jgi:hypothetical protein
MFHFKQSDAAVIHLIHILEISKNGALAAPTGV